ncbi:BRO-N domain-containing protein [Deferrisoma camini]|uniref:BRO-N domain-containing protein n=1 Tax=Deferrisoma camini TaxID=1035120 RepID=UPI00046C9222|nr:BRO family protein [Deferrisoma camini]
MSQVIPFSYGEQAVRTVVDRETCELWFVAKDVCDALGIKNHRDAVSRLDEDEREGVGITDPLGGQQVATAVNESGLYALIFRSRKPAARRFRKWVTSEVLPAIRRTGRYEVDGLRRKGALAELAREFRGALSLARAAGLQGAAAVQRANRVVRELHGVDCLELLGQPDGLAPEPSEVARFVEECCERDPAAVCGATELFTAYRAWAGEEAWSQARFGRAMTALGFGRVKSAVGGRVIYRGLRPKGLHMVEG